MSCFRVLPLVSNVLGRNVGYTGELKRLVPEAPPSQV